MLALLLAGVLTAGGYDGGTTLCTLRDQRIAESSGLVSSSRDGELLFTHNDSGDTARIFEIDRTCRTRATFALDGVQARDWEDISRGPGRTLWLGDIGDNSSRRTQGVLVHRVPEPGPAEGAVRLRPTTFRLTYADGPHDAEALLVHPRTGQLLIVTKGFLGGGVYAAPLPLLPSAPNVLRRVGEVGVADVTAGDISPDGSRVVLRSYTTAYEWDVRGDDVVAALGTDPVEIPLPRAPQGEGITYSADGRSLLTSSEGRGAPLQEMRRLVPARSPAGTPGAAKPPPEASDPSGGDSTFLLLGAGALLAACALAVRRTRARRAR